MHFCFSRFHPILGENISCFLAVDCDASKNLCIKRHCLCFCHNKNKIDSTQRSELYIENSGAHSTGTIRKVGAPSQQIFSFSSQVEENFISKWNNVSKIDLVILNRPCKLDGIKKGLGGRSSTRFNRLHYSLWNQQR